MRNKLALIILLLSFFAQSAVAYNVIDITRGQAEPITIALNKFASDSRTTRILENKILEVVKNDLQHSGIFRALSRAAFIEEKIGADHMPLFAAWQQINSMLLLNGEITRQDDGKIKMRLVLWDSYLERALTKQEMVFNGDNWRKSAHELANIIYKQVTAMPGYFNTKIAYVSETGDYLSRKKRLAIMDYDGHNHEYLTDGRDLVLTPRFSPDAKKIIYLSFKSHVPKLYMMDLKSRESKLIGNFPGMSFAPRFSPDGQYMLMSMSKGPDTHIYEMNLSNQKVTKLTKGNHINTSPSYSPDGKKIVFNSDRNGARQIFVMDRDGGNVERISYGGGAYAEPNWSKDNFIVFTKMSRSIGFAIGIMKPELYQNQNNERLIASGYLVETPAWSGNNQMIVFSRGIRPTKEKDIKGLSRIYTINFSGYGERIVPTPTDASDPDWSRAY